MVYMVLFVVIFPLLIGGFGVLQNTLNKKIAENIGIPLALIINNLVLLSASLLFFFLLKLLPSESVPPLFQQKSGLSTVGWKILLPGMLGFFIICTAPYAIEKVGATKVFIGIIVAQIVVSMLWDYFDSFPITTMRIIGALLALFGAILAIK